MVIKLIAGHSAVRFLHKLFKLVLKILVCRLYGYIYLSCLRRGALRAGSCRLSRLGTGLFLVSAVRTVIGNGVIHSLFYGKIYLCGFGVKWF